MFATDYMIELLKEGKGSHGLATVAAAAAAAAAGGGGGGGNASRVPLP